MNRQNMYPNQRSLQINKDTDGDEVHTSINIHAANTALKVLTPNAFKMWFYFAKNTDGYELALYSIKVMEDCGFKKNTYGKVWKELEDLGYIVKSNLSNSHYDFFERPMTQEEKMIIHKVNDETIEKYLKEQEDQIEQAHSMTMDYLQSLRDSRYKQV